MKKLTSIEVDAPAMQRDLPHKRGLGLGLLFIAISILGACADSPTAPSETFWHVSASVSTAPVDAARITRAIAYAMRDASIRKGVQLAMRSSRVNEHKLVLQDFLKTQEGATLFSGTAAALNIDPRTFSELLASLPNLDFYLPFKAHRLTWKPGSDVYVATTFDPDAPTLTAYGTNGQTRTLERSQGAPAVPLIILHPAEPKLLRDAPQSDTPGDVIQDANDGELATTPLSSSVRGPSFLVECGQECGGGGGSGPSPGTYINHFNIQEGDGWFGNSEMRFHSYAIAGFREFVPGNNGDTWFLVADDICAVGTYAQDGVVEDQGYDGLFLISPTVYRGLYLTCNGRPAFYAINIIEDDGGLLGDDDDYGWRFYAYGGYPAGATYDTVYSYYGNTYPFHYDDPAFNRVAYLRITIY